MSWCVYILECNGGSYYTGITNNIENRLYQHNHGKNGAMWTRYHRPVKLIFKKDGFRDRGHAMKAEHWIKKKLYKNEKIALVNGHPILTKQLEDILNST